MQNSLIIDPNKPFCYTLTAYGQNDFAIKPPLEPTVPSPKQPIFERIKKHSPTIKQRIIKFSKIPFRKIAEFFHSFHDSQIPLKLQYVEFLHGLVVKICNVSQGLKSLSKPLVQAILKVSHVVLKFILESKFVNHLLNTIKLFSVAAIPFALYDIGANIIELFKGSLGEKLEAFLQIISDIGIIGECVGTFALALERFGAYSAQAVSWVTPLFVVCLFLSLANIALYLKNMVESTWLLYQIDRKVKHKNELFKTVEDYQPLFDYLRNRNDRFYSKHFKVGGSQLGPRLDQIWNEALAIDANPQSTVQDREKAVLQLKNAVKTLKVQKIMRLAVTSILIGSSALGFAGGLMFCLTPGLNGFAYFLLIGGVGVGITAFAVGTIGTRRFRKNLGIPKTKGTVRRFIERQVSHLNKKRKHVCNHIWMKFRKRRRADLPNFEKRSKSLRMRERKVVPLPFEIKPEVI